MGTNTRGPTRMLLIMSAAIFATELGIMFFLENVTFERQSTEAFIDSTALILVLFPVLYFFVFRTLVEKNEALAAAEHVLEERIALRTQELQESNNKLSDTLAQLESQHEEMATLGEIGQLFQACREPDETYEVAATQLQRLYKNVPGALYLFRSSRNILERAVQWSDDAEFCDFFEPDDCWALRREKPHETTELNSRFSCSHFVRHEGNSGQCVPISAHGETLGVLCMDTYAINKSDKEVRFHAKAAIPFLTAVTESLALAISNIRLREVLRNQALHDQLTGLHNRRFLEEAMEIEISRAIRPGNPLSVIMIDVDRFKWFNDVYGHDGGDNVLVSVGSYLRDHLRRGDVPCRFGGDEFAILMPNTDAKVAMQRAEEIRRGIESMEVMHQGQKMESVTISCGVASFPDHADTSKGLIHMADQALYFSKENGRNQVTSPKRRDHTAQILKTSASLNE